MPGRSDRDSLVFFADPATERFREVTWCVTGWTSGANEVAAVGIVAASILALFLVLRLGRMAHAHRATPVVAPLGAE